MFYAWRQVTHKHTHAKSTNTYPQNKWSVCECGEASPSLHSCGSPSVHVIHWWWQTGKHNLDSPIKAHATPAIATAGGNMTHWMENTQSPSCVWEKTNIDFSLKRMWKKLVLPLFYNKSVFLLWQSWFCVRESVLSQSAWVLVWFRGFYKIY